MFDDTMKGPLGAIFGDTNVVAQPVRTASNRHRPKPRKPLGHPAVWARDGNVAHVDFGRKGG